MSSSFFNNSVNEGEMRAIVRHNRRKGIEISQETGTFLIMMFKYDFEQSFIDEIFFLEKNVPISIDCSYIKRLIGAQFLIVYLNELHHWSGSNPAGTV